MRKIKEAKVLQVLNLKKRGLGPADVTRILGYGHYTVEAIYSGNYEMIFFSLPEDRKLEEKMVMTSEGEAVLIDKQGYEFQDYDEQAESAEDVCIRKEEAEHLYAVLGTLSKRDRAIIQAKADGQTNFQIRNEFKTSPGHIKKIQENLKKLLTS